jgi:hypothetical protein
LDLHLHQDFQKKPDNDKDKQEGVEMASSVQPVASPRKRDENELADDEDPFIIPPKASVDALRKWRVGSLPFLFIFII